MTDFERNTGGEWLKHLTWNMTALCNINVWSVCLQEFKHIGAPLKVRPTFFRGNYKQCVNFLEGSLRQSQRKALLEGLISSELWRHWERIEIEALNLTWAYLVVINQISHSNSSIQDNTSIEGWIWKHFNQNALPSLFGWFHKYRQLCIKHDYHWRPWESVMTYKIKTGV